MKISTKGRYALRLMLDIAQHGEDGGCVSLKDVSVRQQVSMKYLEQIVTQLSRAGLLKSVRGAQGGYRLTRRPEEYRVGDVLRITEGNLAPVACLEDSENRCERSHECATLDFWTGLYAVINQYIDRFTLADLVRTEQEKEHPAQHRAEC